MFSFRYPNRDMFMSATLTKFILDDLFFLVLMKKCLEHLNVKCLR